MTNAINWITTHAAAQWLYWVQYSETLLAWGLWAYPPMVNGGMG